MLDTDAAFGEIRSIWHDVSRPILEREEALLLIHPKVPKPAQTYIRDLVRIPHDTIESGHYTFDCMYTPLECALEILTGAEIRVTYCYAHIVLHGDRLGSSQCRRDWHVMPILGVPSICEGGSDGHVLWASDHYAATPIQEQIAYLRSPLVIELAEDITKAMKKITSGVYT